MVETWVVPELGHNFIDSFSKMLIDKIYEDWSFTTGYLAKPVTPQGQTQSIEFRRGIPGEFKSISVTTLQQRTVVREYIQLGQKIQSMQTGVTVTLRVMLRDIDAPDDYLTDMEQELQRICGQYQQANQVGELAGIKDLIYEGGERQYLPEDTWDKKEWASTHLVQMWYQLNDIQ